MLEAAVKADSAVLPVIFPARRRLMALTNRMLMAFF